MKPIPPTTGGGKTINTRKTSRVSGNDKKAH